MSPSSARKVPWSSPTEFITVFDLLFTSSDPAHDQSIALNHLYAWSIRSPSSLPPAIEATHALLSLLSPSDLNAYQQRLGLAMALTRLVNSLVDPLQTGLYARSISQIASELGLPLNFVQLRHRATHEDLPSHSNLLESAKLALDWLYIHYWLPRLNDIEGTGKLKQETITSLESLLLSFKRARKQAMTDATERGFQKVLPKLNDWISLASRELRGDGGRNRLAEEESGSEVRPLAVLCWLICEREVLVPRSEKKRCKSLKDSLPERLESLYKPLIDHLAQSYPLSFMRSLISALLDVLSMSAEELNDNRSVDQSYYNTCAAWLVYLLLRSDGEFMVQEAVRSLLLQPNHYTLSVMEKLRQVDRPDWFMEDRVGVLLNVLEKARQTQRVDPSDHDFFENEIKSMTQRWESLKGQDERVAVEGSTWQLVPETEWSPCPIGCLPDKTVPDLYKSLV